MNGLAVLRVWRAGSGFVAGEDTVGVGLVGDWGKKAWDVLSSETALFS